ncbi:hypothetical protein AGR5A_Lc50149 [Agrobacterium genomosp. 5 str. CFBP 6626]|nr:hypothetical protein AGR5A_Lc50149 [Agrobacterium genomosp. 5 str. CFBP 6626]
MLSAETRRKIAVIRLYKPNLLGHSRLYWGKELQCKGIPSAAEEIATDRCFRARKGQATREEINGYQEDASGVGRCRMRSFADHRSCRYVGQKNRAFKQLCR